MRSEGFSSKSGGLEVGVVFAQRCSSDRNPPQPSAVRSLSLSWAALTKCDKKILANSVFLCILRHALRQGNTASTKIESPWVAFICLAYGEQPWQQRGPWDPNRLALAPPQKKNKTCEPNFLKHRPLPFSISLVSFRKINSSQL